jgi:NAD(P)-dependent dehydrogenase (short-subunit alcohol dehydrogenase family)
MRFDGKCAVVTGASSGIGRATAEAFAAAGARVLLGDIAEAAGAEVAAGIRARDGAADFIRVDVTDPTSVAGFRDRALKLGGHVDIVANVAGWAR